MMDNEFNNNIDSTSEESSIRAITAYALAIAAIIRSVNDKEYAATINDADRGIGVIENGGMDSSFFHDDYYKKLYESLERYQRDNGTIPSPTVLLGDTSAPWQDYILEEYNQINTLDDIGIIRSQVWEEHLFQQLSPVVREAAKKIQIDAESGLEYLQESIDGLSSAPSTSNGVDITKDLSRADDYRDRHDNKGYFIPTGFGKLDEKISGFAPGDELVVLFARTGVGKEQPLYSRILTPTGWTTMEKIKLGDEVYTGTGKVAKVSGIFPQGKKPVYRVNFSDGSHADAGLDHLWEVTSESDVNERSVFVTKTTKELLYAAPRSYYVNPIPNIDIHSDKYLIDGWLLGVYLACGYTPKTVSGDSYARFRLPLSIECELIDLIRSKLSELNCKTELRIVKSSYVIECKEPVIRDLFREFIYSNDLISTKSAKLIPQFVYDTSYEYRRSVLAGIMDSKGRYVAVISDKFPVIYTSSRIAADGIALLARSLGDRATVAVRNQSHYSVRFNCINNPFRMSKLKDKWACRFTRKSICSIELVGCYECQCIMVDDPSHTYITDDYTITHNTWILTKMLYEAWRSGFNVGLIEPEMTASRIGYRFDTFHGKFSNSELVYGRDLTKNESTIPESEYRDYLSKLAQSSSKFMVATPKDFNGRITVPKIKRWIMQNDVKVLGIDGISYIDDSRMKYGDSITTSLTHISADLMDLSVELRIPIIVVVQSNRGGTENGGKLALENIRDSDGIAYSASMVMGFYRKNNALHIQMLKHRNGDAGFCLVYDWDIDRGSLNFIQEGELQDDGNVSGDNNGGYTPNDAPTSKASKPQSYPNRPSRVSEDAEYSRAVNGPANAIRPNDDISMF